MTSIDAGNADRNRIGRAPGLWAWRILIARHGPKDQAMRACLWALATFLDEDGNGWATQAQIAAASCLSDRTVRAKLHEASRAAWLGMMPRGETGRRWKSYMFRACIPDMLVIEPRSDRDEFPQRVEELIDAVEARCSDVSADWLRGSHFQRPERGSGHEKAKNRERPEPHNAMTGTSQRHDRKLTADRPAGGSDTVTNTVPLSVPHRAGPVSRPDPSQGQEEGRKGMAHVSSHLQTRKPSEPVRQPRESQPKVESDEYRRAVVRLSGMGFKPKEIAAQTHMSTKDVTTILQAEAG